MTIRLPQMILTVFLFLSGSNLQAAQAEQKPAQEQKQEKKKQAQIEQTVLGMNVSGNKELPNVLYIVPWKDDAELNVELKATRLVNEIYAPVDADTFSKKVKLFNQLKSVAKTSNSE